MNKVIKINFLKRATPSALLGLSLDGSRLQGIVLRRSNGSLQVLQQFSVALSLDPLTNDAELVGREILNHLQAANIRERHCVVALPLKWALAAHTQIPKLSAADIPDFLQIEAERGFPTDVATLQVATSRLTGASGEEHATFIGMPKSHVERLEQVLRAAKLKPVSFSLGIIALQPARTAESTGVLSLVLSEHHVGLQITCGGGVAALRALEGAMESESVERLLHGELIAREARITLGQLPADLRESVKLIRIFGPRDQAERLAAEIRPRFEPVGMKVEIVSVYQPGEFGKTLPADTKVSAALSLAARQLVGRTDPFEFLPPKISAWQRMTSRYAPGRLRKLGAAAAFVLLVVIGLFVYQQVQLVLLRSKWRDMSAEVRQLEDTSQKIVQYRPWFDRTFQTLRLMKDLATAFPEDGSVTAKMLEFRDMNTVSCSGTADNYNALLRTMQALGNTNAVGSNTISGVYNLSVQTRGKAPMQFTLNFQRRPGGANESR
jgi:hypothetical protein